jgi:hypothetical protein
MRAPPGTAELRLILERRCRSIECEATGILMAQHQIKRGEAVGMLRRMSRTKQRQMHEVAVGVVQAADLQRAPHSRADSADRTPSRRGLARLPGREHCPRPGQPDS